MIRVLSVFMSLRLMVSKTTSWFTEPKGREREMTGQGSKMPLAQGKLTWRRPL